jgi:hypothetical protein
MKRLLVLVVSGSPCFLSIGLIIRRRTIRIFLGLGVVLLSVLLIPAFAPVAGPANRKTQLQSAEAYGSLALTFEHQDDESFVARGTGHAIFLDPTGATMVLPERGPGVAARPGQRADSTTVALRVALLDANPHPPMTGVDELQGKVNYLLGDDPTRWRTDVPTFAKVEAKGVYPGID